MVEKKLFAADLGASGGKCFVGVFSKSGFRMDEVHRFAHEGVSFFMPDKEGRVTERVYWDDTYIYINIVKGLQAARQRHGAVLESIGIDTWGADGQLIGWDGDLMGKVYCYRDHRLDLMCDEVRGCIDPARVYEITGIHFQPFNLSNQLRWLVTRRPELVERARVYLPTPTLFHYYLGARPAVDSTFASVTQLMDAGTGEWSDEILMALGIPRHLMPEIVKPGTGIGRLTPALAVSCGLNEAELIAVGSHDTACAFASAPVGNTDKALIISSGTWSLVGRLLPGPLSTPDAMAAGMSNEGGIGNTRFLRNCMGTWIVQELLRGWERVDGKRMSWREVDTITPAAAPLRAFIDPDDARFYNPGEMEEAVRGFIKESGQEMPEGRGGLLRCVYESLALKYRKVDEMICALSGTTTERVHIVGGGSNNALLNQFTANSLGVPVVAGPMEATAVGNLMVQAVGAGILSSLEEAMPFIQSAFQVQEFEPREREAWERAYAEFSRLV